jgi:hypothetical protein
MIKIVCIERGRLAPKVFCDHCDTDIDDSQDGNYEYLVDTTTGIPLPGVYFTHKRCCHAFEVMKRRGDASWCAESLAELPFRLAANLNMPMKITRTDPMIITCTLQGKILDFQDESAR